MRAVPLTAACRLTACGSRWLPVSYVDPRRATRLASASDPACAAMATPKLPALPCPALPTLPLSLHLSFSLSSVLSFFINSHTHWYIYIFITFFFFYYRNFTIGGWVTYFDRLPDSNINLIDLFGGLFNFDFGYLLRGGCKCVGGWERGR